MSFQDTLHQINYTRASKNFTLDFAPWNSTIVGNAKKVKPLKRQ